MLSVKYPPELLEKVMCELPSLQNELQVNLRYHIDDLKKEMERQLQQSSGNKSQLKSVRRLFRDFSALKEHHLHTAISAGKLKGLLTLFTSWNLLLLTPLSFASNANPYPSMISVAALLLTTPLFLISNKMAHSLISRSKQGSLILDLEPMEGVPYRNFSDDLNHLSTWIKFYKQKLNDSQRWLDCNPGLILNLEDLDLAPVSVLSITLSYICYVVCYFTLPISMLTSLIPTLSLVFLWFPASCMIFQRFQSSIKSNSNISSGSLKRPFEALWQLFGYSHPLAIIESDYTIDPSAWRAGTELSGSNREVILERNLREGEEICYNILLNSKGHSFDELQHSLDIDSHFLQLILSRMKA